MVNVEDVSCSLMMGIPTKEWDDLPSPGIIFFQTLSHEVLHMEPITNKVQEVLARKKLNANKMCMGDTILDAVAEASIY